MRSEPIRWFTVSRNDLLDVILGDIRPSGVGRLTLASDELKRDAVIVGCADRLSSSAYSPPTIIVLDDSRFAETFAWIRAYAAEGSPLSQFARVVLASDWNIFGTEQQRLHGVQHREDHWASVILGETLSQGDSEVDLESLPLSRSTGTFSMPVARAALIHGLPEATRTCVDRLRAIEVDARFTRKAVSTDQLLPIWSFSSMDFAESSPSEVAMLVMDAALNYLHADGFQAHRLRQDLSFDAFYSDSVESRVIAFNRMSAEVLQSARALGGGGLPAAILATAAFLVGRSTSHYFLLKRVVKEVPAAFAWFGLIAAKAGPRAWDAGWLRALKGVERLLKPNLDWLDPPAADLSWSEFSWFASTFEGSEVFSALPKMLPRTLGVEVVPGASFQFRLAAATSIESEGRSNIQAQVSSNQALLETISDVVTLLHRLESRVSGVASVQQKGLPFGDSLPETPKEGWKAPSKPKKAKRTE